MTPFMSLLLPVAASAVAVFVLTMLIHMTPWHKGDYVAFPDEDGVMNALRAFNIPPNDYATPHPRSMEYMKSPEFDAKCNAGPVMFLTVLPNGPFKMGKMLGLWFVYVTIVSAIAACFVGMLIPLAEHTHPHTIMHHIGVVTFVSYGMGVIPMSIWYGRKWSTTFKYLIDSLLSAAVTALIFSMMWPTT